MRAFDARTSGDRERATLHNLRIMRAGGPSEADLRAQLDRLVPPFPLKVQVQTTTRCNAACTMCPYPEITAEPAFVHAEMGDMLFAEILRQLAGRGVERLSLFLMNEPLLDKRMPERVALARSALPTTTLGLFTNGSALTAATAVRLAEAGLDELCVSVHGYDAATYERVMRGLRFSRTARNLRTLLDLRDSGRLGRLRVILVTGDVPELRDSLAGADGTLRGLAQLKAFSNERQAAGVRPDLPSSLPTARNPALALCQRPFVKLYVLANGDCVLCNVDWRRTTVLGRIGAEPGGQIAAIWRSEAYTRVRLDHLRHHFAAGHVCAGCDYPLVADLE